MPTGYTADVGDGKMNDFSDFALTCARGFGALVMLRDSDQSLEATKRYIAEEAYVGSSSYYSESLAASRERLAALEAMTNDEVLAAAQAAADERIASNLRYAQERTEKRERYGAMLAKVEAWTPPTEDHVAFQTFMVEQLTSSIDFDCGEFSMAVPEVSLHWRSAEIERERASIVRCEGEIVKEREREEGRRAWVKALTDSLEFVTA